MNSRIILICSHIDCRYVSELFTHQNRHSSATNRSRGRESAMYFVTIQKTKISSHTMLLWAIFFCMRYCILTWDEFELSNKKHTEIIYAIR